MATKKDFDKVKCFKSLLPMSVIMKEDLKRLPLSMKRIIMITDWNTKVNT